MPRCEPREDLSAEYVRSILLYNPITGALWYRAREIRPGYERHDKTWNARYARETIRPLSGNRYRTVRIDGVCYKAHRVAWLIHYGRWPDGILDHESRVRSDNWISNLREADFSKNSMNSGIRSDNASGMKGIGFIARIGKWRARIGIDGKNRYLGVFATAEEAVAAYKKAAALYHGDFASTECQSKSPAPSRKSRL